MGQAQVYERREAAGNGNERSEKVRHRKGSQQICARCTEKTNLRGNSNERNQKVKQRKRSRQMCAKCTDKYLRDSSQSDTAE